MWLGAICTASVRTQQKVLDDQKPPQIEFAHDELLSLYLGQQMMQPLSGTPLFSGYRNLMAKVKANQPRAVEELAEVFLKHFQIVPFGQCDYSEKTELLSALIHAVNNDREVAITYQSLKSEKPKTYPVHPYAFFYHRGALYIVAFSPDTGKTKHLKLNRLFSVAETGKAFKRPSTWNLADSRNRSFGVFTPSDKPQVVSIHFEGWAASHVKEATWHKTQEITMHDDGSLTLKMTVADLTEVQTWVLGFGPQAKFWNRKFSSRMFAKQQPTSADYTLNSTDDSQNKSCSRLDMRTTHQCWERPCGHSGQIHPTVAASCCGETLAGNRDEGCE